MGRAAGGRRKREARRWRRGEEGDRGDRRKKRKHAGEEGERETEGWKEGSRKRPPPLSCSAGVPHHSLQGPQSPPCCPMRAPPFPTAQVTPLSGQCSEDPWEAGSGASPACGPQHCVLGTPPFPQPHSGPSPLSRRFLHSFPRAHSLPVTHPRQEPQLPCCLPGISKGLTLFLSGSSSLLRWLSWL